MARYSRRHYKAVSPAADTQAQIIARLVAQRALELAREDRLVVFPVLDFSNADAVLAYQEHCVKFHTTMLYARPNWRKPKNEIDRLVRSSTLRRTTDGPEIEAHIIAVIERIVEIGEAVWHAAALVSGRQCNCAQCHQVSR